MNTNPIQPAPVFDPALIDALSLRLRRLERRSRFFARLAFLAILAGSIAGGYAWMRWRKPEEKRPDLLSLRDARGVVRVELGVRPDGRPSLELRDLDGRPRFRL